MEGVITARYHDLSDRMVAALPKKRNRYTFADPEIRGHYVRVMPQGPNVFAAMARNPLGKQVWATLGNANVLTSRSRATRRVQRSSG